MKCRKCRRQHSHQPLHLSCHLSQLGPLPNCDFHALGQAEADTLRAAALETKEGAGHSLPEANGDGAEAGPELGTGDGTGVGKAEMEALKEELQRLVEALKVSEASRVGVENLLAEAKQVMAVSWVFACAPWWCLVMLLLCLRMRTTRPPHPPTPNPRPPPPPPRTESSTEACYGLLEG